MRMSDVRVNMMMSLDGYTAGPDQSAEHPFGTGGEQLTEWLMPLRSFREAHGEEGGEDNASGPIVEGWLKGVGATVMGRNMFGGGPGPWGDDPWTGYWGEEPPYHHPVFVLTHHEREPLEMKGGTTFHFVTDGIDAALSQARDAAGDQDVSIGGGAATVNQYLAAGVIDEILISLVPVFLGAGSRLFDDLGGANLKPEPVEVVDAPGVTHIRYRASS
jgi:dihydrofolate reductase